MKQINLFDVSGRDGFQALEYILTTKEKIELHELLIEAGINNFEIASIVGSKHPYHKKFTDNKEVREALQRNHLGEELQFYALTPPENYMFTRAIDAGFSHIGTFLSVHPKHHLKNTGRTIEKSAQQIKKIITLAEENNITLRLYFPVAFGNKHPRDVTYNMIETLVKELSSPVIKEYSFGDTHTLWTPNRIKELAKISPIEKTSYHFHQNNNILLEKQLELSLQAGITTFHGALNGIGGCTPTDQKNANLEIMIDYMHQKGYETSIDLQKLSLASQYLMQIIQKHK